MAIKFEDDKGAAKPAKKEVGGKAYVAEEPASAPSADRDSVLPFAKVVRPDKKGPKIRNKPPVSKS